MFRQLMGLGLGWFVYTKTGRKTAKNIALNCLPLLEKELGIKIKEPLQELIKDHEEVKDGTR